MSASDAYVEWWAAGVDPVVLVDRLLDAGFRWGLEPGSVMVEVLDEEGESTPTPVREFRDLLRLADGRVTFQLWLDDGGYLVVSRWRVLLNGERRVVDRVTCYLDALLPYEFDGTVTVAASLVTDFPERTLVWVLDGSNDTAAFDWESGGCG